MMVEEAGKPYADTSQVHVACVAQGHTVLTMASVIGSYEHKIVEGVGHINEICSIVVPVTITDGCH